MSAGCIVPLLPGAAQVRVTTDPRDVSACIDVGNVSGVGADLSTIYLHQMQNQAVAMDADTVFRSGNGGHRLPLQKACRCPPVTLELQCDLPQPWLAKPGLAATRLSAYQRAMT